MIRFIIGFIVLTLFTLSSANANEVVIGKSETLNSQVLNETRKLFISLPENYDKTGYNYPVLYFSDAHAHFEIMASTVNFLTKANKIPPMILVGIDTSENRVRDLTPIVYDEEEKNHPWFKSVNYGGASKFANFIESELVPHINKKYRTTDFKVFSGHSFGGLFSFYTYLNKPNLFDGYMAISPSLGWDKERLVAEAKHQIEQKTLSKAAIYLSKGNEKGTTGASYTAITQAFESVNIDSVSSQEFPDESHLTVVFDAHYHGLTTLFKAWPLSYAQSAKGLEVVITHINNVKDTFKINFSSERWLINLGNSEHYKKNYNNAIEAYKHNISLFPNSDYSYFLLARTYEANGQLKIALKHYEKANQMVDSNHANKGRYHDAISKLKAKLKN